MNDNRQTFLPALDTETAAKVETDEDRRDFERTRYRGKARLPKARQGRLFDYLNDNPDQTHLFDKETDQ